MSHGLEALGTWRKEQETLIALAIVEDLLTMQPMPVFGGAPHHASMAVSMRLAGMIQSRGL